MQEKVNAFAENESVRVNLRPSSPHSLGCRATQGRGAALQDPIRDTGEEGGVMEPSEQRELKVPLEELEHPCGEDIALTLEPDNLFWQL